MTTSPPPNPQPTDLSLWRHADFLRLWGAQVISAFGSRITRTALPIIAVTTLGQPGAVLGVLAAMQLVPGVILAMLAGGFVDRGRKRRILIASDLVRAGLVASLTLAWALGALTMLQVVIVGACVGAATALFQITDVAYLPALIGRRRLVEGNAKLETTEAIAEITGPASAGVLIAALGAPLAVAIDAVSYAWSAFMLGRIRAVDGVHPGHPGPPAATAQPPAAAAPTAAPVALVAPVAPVRPIRPDNVDDVVPVRTGEDFRIGLRAVFGHPLVRPIVLTLMVWSILGGFFMALYTPYCLRELGLSEAAFGVIIAMGGIGALAGALLARTLARILGVGRTLFATSVLSLTCTLFIPLAASGMNRVQTLRQTVIPRDTLGRANAAVHVCTIGVAPVAALIAGGLASLVGFRNAVWIGTLIGLTAPIFVWRLRHLKDMPAGDLGASDAGLSRSVSRD